MRYVITRNNEIIHDKLNPDPDTAKGMELYASSNQKCTLHRVESIFPPPGKRLENNQLVEMSEAEKISSGFYTPDEIKNLCITAIQNRLDEFARSRGYDSILSACTYATSTNQSFAAEGQRCVELRDATWAAAYQILADVQSGLRPLPDVETLLNELPDLTWI